MRHDANPIMSFEINPDMKNPSVWLAVTTHVGTESFICLRNPHQPGKHPASFVHFVARALYDREIDKRTEASGPAMASIALNPVLANMVGYSLYLQLQPSHDISVLHFENSPLFSGKEQNNPVAFVHLDLGKSEQVPVVPEANSSTLPTFIQPTEQNIQACQNVRDQLTWMPLSQVLPSIIFMQNGRLNHDICAPESSPLVYKEKREATFHFKQVAGKETKVQQAVAFCLQTLSKKMAAPCPQWVPVAFINMARSVRFGTPTCCPPRLNAFSLTAGEG